MSSVILINPWIYDFAAYDLWSKPLGLLYIAGYLRNQNISINIIDCMDVNHPEMKKSKTLVQPVRRAYGTGKYFRDRVTKPDALKHIKRSYFRYGITTQIFKNDLKKIKDPSAILVTSLMTYWYPGVVEAIRLAREIHPNVPVVLGGIYARLCEDHAKKVSGADYVASDITLETPHLLLNILEGLKNSLKSSHAGPLFPAFDMLNKIDYVCLHTSTGCPYKCKYCASSILYPRYSRREPDEVVDEIGYWNREYNVEDFAFYDDALLIGYENHIGVILEKVLEKGLKLRFHTPNALHLKEISSDLARLLYISGFKTIRLGLETSDINLHDILDKKVSEGDFERAVKNLLDAGFKKREIGAYILMGLPGQSVDSVSRTIEFSDNVGAIPYLAEYSPLPGTELWEKAVESSDYDLMNEPLFHNNSLLPCWDEDKRKRVSELKKMVREVREKSD